MILRTYINRKTEAEIALHKHAAGWFAVECRGHGEIADYDTEEEAEKYLIHSEKFCVGCSEGDPVREKPHNNANEADFMPASLN